MVLSNTPVHTHPLTRIRYGGYLISHKAVSLVSQKQYYEMNPRNMDS